MKPYPFQQEAIDYMQNSNYFLLADDLGLGKTFTTLSECKVLLENKNIPDRHVLIVCPKSVINVWVTHSNMLMPDREVFVLTGTKAERDKTWKAFEASPNSANVILNWDGLRVMKDELLGVRWFNIIADEAHYIKNRNSQRAKYLKYLRAYHKRALTGTPVINRPDELWSILNWLNPREYKSYWRFYNDYVDYTTNYMGFREIKGPKNEARLQQSIKPFFLQRKKEEVLKELPDKYYSFIEVPLDDKQKRAYNEMKSKSVAFFGTLGDQPLPAPTALSQLTRLRQLCVAYGEVNADGELRMSEPSTKLTAMMDIVEDSSTPVVVFSQFKQAIKLAEVRLTAEKIPFATITGDTKDADRNRIIDEFQEGKYSVLLLSMKAGGIGITLHRASTCIFLDRHWSPAINQQAEDRLHRIGQKNAVQVIVLQAPESVDKIVEDQLELKASWIKRMLES